MGRWTTIAEADTEQWRRLVQAGLAGLALITLANCSATGKLGSKVDPKYGVSASPRVVPFGQPIPKGGGTYRVGKPYRVAGRLYVPRENPRYRAEGTASWYGRAFHGRLTANGEVYDMNSLSAAHPTLPIPSYVRVTNLRNRRSVVVRVNDRGPFHGNREIDLSKRTAEVLDFKKRGVARVRVEYVGRASLSGSDDRVLLATLRHGRPAPTPAQIRQAQRHQRPRAVRSQRAQRQRKSDRWAAAKRPDARRSQTDGAAPMTVAAARRPGQRQAARPLGRDSGIHPRPTVAMSGGQSYSMSAVVSAPRAASTGFVMGRGLY